MLNLSAEWSQILPQGPFKRTLPRKCSPVSAPRWREPSTWWIWPQKRLYVGIWDVGSQLTRRTKFEELQESAKIMDIDGAGSEFLMERLWLRLSRSTIQRNLRSMSMTLLAHHAPICSQSSLLWRKSDLCEDLCSLKFIYSIFFDLIFPKNHQCSWKKEIKKA